ncbi:hypothetical protein CR513_36809, partial [Mucuna pruriens]
MKNFEMKDLGKGSFVLGIQILRDRSQDRFNMNDSKPGETLMAKGDKFSLKQCPNNDLERNEIQKIPYASKVGSLMYDQVCTRPDIAFVVGVLGRLKKDQLEIDMLDITLHATLDRAKGRLVHNPSSVD